MNRGIKDLQSSALPLGYVALFIYLPHRSININKLPPVSQGGNLHQALLIGLGPDSNINKRLQPERMRKRILSTQLPD